MKATLQNGGYMMLMRQQWIIFVFIGFIIIGSIVYLNWDLYEIKKGHKLPVMWSSIDDYIADIQRFETPKKKVEKFNLNITDFYILPDLERLHFGIWYSKWSYNTVDDDIPRIVFSILIIDDIGNVYPANTFSLDSSIGLFYRYQNREVRGLRIDQVNTLTMQIQKLRTVDGEDIIVDTEEILIYEKYQSDLKIVEN